MVSINDLINSLNGFITWADDSGEQKAGIPKESSTQLYNLSKSALGYVQAAKSNLSGLRTIWNNIIKTNDYSTANDSGNKLRFMLTQIDSNLHQVLSIFASHQAQLHSFIPMVQRHKENSDKKLVQVRKHLSFVKAEASKFNAQMIAANNQRDRNAANQNWMEWMQNQNAADWAVSNEANINSQLANCTALLQKIKTLDQTVTNYRNSITSIDSDLEEVIKNEQKVMATKSEKLSKYYKRKVGIEMESLLSVI